MPVTANVQLMVTGQQTSVLDLGTGSFPFALSVAQALADGTAANQVDRVFTDTRTLAASANEDLDLAGVLTNAFGAVITMAKVVGVFISAAAGNTNGVRVTRPASNSFPMFVAASDAIDIPPGGFFAIFGPALAGIGTVTATSADLINILNNGAGTSVTYSIVILGRSA